MVVVFYNIISANVTRIYIRVYIYKLRQTRRRTYPARQSKNGGEILERRVEWPTVALAAGIYGAWFGLLTAAPWIGPAAVALLLVPVLVLHSSLQHEILHGHPFRDPRLNALLGLPALGLFLPYGRFAATHLAHHETADLTDPHADPESHYTTPEDWGRFGPVRRGILQINRCLAGRLILAPPRFLFGLMRSDIRAIGRGDRPILRDWLAHLATVPIVIALIVFVSGIPLWLYALSAVGRPCPCCRSGPIWSIAPAARPKSGP